MLACVAGKPSHLTMADYRRFSDPMQQEPHTALITLAQLNALAMKFNPADFYHYISAAKVVCLNGIHLPFW